MEEMTLASLRDPRRALADTCVYNRYLDADELGDTKLLYK
jgi:hypothetical protein